MLFVGTILLFYTYTFIEYPKRILKWQQQICTDLGLKGRILLGHEGINGTVGGETENIERYKAIMRTNELFADIDFKESAGTADDFPKLAITVRDEIVRLGIPPEQLSSENAGTHLTPAQTHELIESKHSNLVILDARNNFESAIGAFQGAIKPDIEHFRDFPAFIDQNPDLFKDKQVLMYCTGGIRCERASSYVKQHTQAESVYQMSGGIHSYVEQYPDGFFRGKNYVFDNRIALPVTPDILAQCVRCDSPCDDYTNCMNVLCNKHYISCSSCLELYANTCSVACQDLVTQNKVKLRSKTVRPTQSVQQRV